MPQRRGATSPELPPRPLGFAFRQRKRRSRAGESYAICKHAVFIPFLATLHNPLDWQYHPPAREPDRNVDFRFRIAVVAFPLPAGSAANDLAHIGAEREQAITK